MSPRSVIPPGRRAVRATVSARVGAAACRARISLSARAGTGDRAPAKVQHGRVLSGAAVDPGAVRLPPRRGRDRHRRAGRRGHDARAHRLPMQRRPNAADQPRSVAALPARALRPGRRPRGRVLRPVPEVRVGCGCPGTAGIRPEWATLGSLRPACPGDKTVKTTSLVPTGEVCRCEPPLAFPRSHAAPRHSCGRPRHHADRLGSIDIDGHRGCGRRVRRLACGTRGCPRPGGAAPRCPNGAARIAWWPHPVRY